MGAEVRTTNGRQTSVPTSAWRLCLPLVVVAIGCGRAPEAVVVTGSVTYQGRPIERGKIRFVPREASVTPISGAYISAGKYKVIAKGGVPYGTHKIMIVAHRPTASYLRQHGPPTPETEWDQVPKEQYLPARYNAQTELEVTIESGSREVIKNFVLKD